MTTYFLSKYLFGPLANRKFLGAYVPGPLGRLNPDMWILCEGLPIFQSVEERRTVRDGEGNEETTVTRSYAGNETPQGKTREDLMNTDESK